MATQQPITTLTVDFDLGDSRHPHFPFLYSTPRYRRADSITKEEIDTLPGVYEVRSLWKAEYKWLWVGRAKERSKEGLQHRLNFLLNGPDNFYSARRHILNCVEAEAPLSVTQKQLTGKALDRELLKWIEIGWTVCDHETILLEYLLHLRYDPLFKDRDLFPLAVWPY